MIFQTGDIIFNGKYRVEELAGKGGFAEVYQVTHLRLNTPRALKVLRRDMPGVGSSDFQDYREKFDLEAQLGARLDDANVIKVYDVEEEGDDLCLVMEWAPGGSLQNKLEKARPLSIDGAVRLALDLCDGLTALHEQLRVVHRDLKPSNILFGQDGVAKIGDLGLAQVPGGVSRRSLLGSQANYHPGTPAYMSPEQGVTKDYLLPTSDVFSLGCVLFEALTGIHYKAVYDSRPSDHRPEVPAWLDLLVRRMLAEQPGRVADDDSDLRKRYRRAGLVRAALEQGRQTGQQGQTTGQMRETLSVPKPPESLPPSPTPVAGRDTQPDAVETQRPAAVTVAAISVTEAAVETQLEGDHQGHAAKRPANPSPPSAVDGTSARILSPFSWRRWFFFSWIAFTASISPITANLEFLFWFVPGALIGISQWIVLRRSFERMGWWVGVVALSWPVGLLTAWVTPLYGYRGGEARFLVAGATMGLVSGTIQWILLRRWIRQAGWWPAFAIVSWSIALPWLAYPEYRNLGDWLLWGGGAVALPYAGITALGFVVMLGDSKVPFSRK